jgi:hypothetical protein
MDEHAKACSSKYPKEGDPDIPEFPKINQRLAALAA